MKLVRKTKDCYTFYCLGCFDWHKVGLGWEFNNDFKKPTFSPSILVSGYNKKSEKFRCHSFIKNGKIEYLDDCSHKLKGQTVELTEDCVHLD